MRGLWRSVTTTSRNYLKIQYLLNIWRVELGIARDSLVFVDDLLLSED